MRFPMKKQRFLAELEKALSCLSSKERLDILRDIEEHFHEGISHGKSEEAIVKKLGSPNTLAETIIAETKVKRISEANTLTEKTSALCGALFAILLLAPFNLIFIALPLFLATLLLIIGWPIMFGIILFLPFIWVINLLFAIHVGFHLFSLLALFFFAIGCLGFVITLIIGFSGITLLYFKAVARLLKWNLQFIKSRM